MLSSCCVCLGEDFRKLKLVIISCLFLNGLLFGLDCFSVL